MNLDQFERVGREAQVIRVVRVGVRAHFDPLGPVIQPDAFNVTSSDEESARKRNEPAHLSVFDLGLTTQAQAIAIRNTGSTASDAMVAFALSVASIEDAMNDAHVRRFPRPEFEQGGAGHCGILGLHKDQQPDKLARRAFKDALCTIATLLPEEEAEPATATAG